MTVHQVPFLDVFADESGGNIKTPQAEYQNSGRFPVVDQGKLLVAGYVDDESRLCGAGQPAIVFGDHTRCVKYIDFPFCMGADGVKVLRSKIEADLKYLYHYLRQLNLPDTGYNRHFKYLKRAEIVLPPLSYQRRIAAILDQADALRAKRREASAQLDNLTQSIFIEMFGDPETNTKGIRTTILANLCNRITDGTHQSPKWSVTGYPFLFVSNIVSGEIDFDTRKFISEETYAELTLRCPIELGDVLYSTVGSYGVPAVVRTERKFSFQRHIAHLKPNPELLDSEFLCAMLASPPLRRQAGRLARGVAQKTLNLSEISKFLVFQPPLDMQKEFSTRIKSLELLKLANRQSSTELDNLFSSLQHRAFRGEL